MIAVFNFLIKVNFEAIQGGFGRYFLSDFMEKTGNTSQHREILLFY